MKNINYRDMDVNEKIIFDLIRLGMRAVGEVSSDMLLGKGENKVFVSAQVMERLCNDGLDVIYRQVIPLQAVRESNFNPKSLNLEFKQYLTGKVIPEDKVQEALKQGLEVRYSEDIGEFYAINCSEGL
ncbi:conserved hypothetical protein [Methanococcus maripaludis C5]|uniref:Uncharacterized protein n=1 Tax=Methanococcus maripaludis (strain C5 / ATCC BAA-1333) TaxID=402880 RepID=A4FYY7_METM5|nr:hypothetical protein [Methanococcus maripaludis]ABO35421.1 conserved hypothetical protein [Methanococcus maripaludis C5]